ncbi:MAG: hypothetical protein U0935_02240 [Pirellulales bacterium]
MTYRPSLWKAARRHFRRACRWLAWPRQAWQTACARRDQTLEHARLHDVAHLLSTALRLPDTCLFDQLLAVMQGPAATDTLQRVVKVEAVFSQIDVHHVRYLIRALVWENGHAVLYETQRLLSWFDLPRQIRGQLRAAPHHEACYRIL